MTQIENSDEVARSLYDPKDGSITADIINLIPLIEKNLQFEHNEEDDARTESVNCLRLLEPNPIDNCHTLGIRKLEKNVRDAQASGFECKIKSYIGFKKGNVGQIRSEAQCEAISFEVIHKPIAANENEEENSAHCNIVLTGYVQGQPKKHRQVAIKLLSEILDKDFTKYSQSNN